MPVGPRNRRRLATAGVALAAVVVVAAGGSLLLSSGGSHPSVPKAPAGFPSTLTLGMTRQQVQRLTGPPGSTRGACRRFRVSNYHVGSVSVAPFDPPAIELCFSSGRLAKMFQRQYDPQKKRSVWLPWSPASPASRG